MAMLDVGSGHGGDRQLDHALPLVPFIDFMLSLVTFLLLTAAWSQMSRINADASAGTPAGTPPPPHKELHVAVREHSYDLAWKDGTTVISSASVERHGAPGDARLPDLAARIQTEWNGAGAHRAAGDHDADRAVIHTTNTVSYGEIIAVMDAIASAHKADGSPAFATSLAVN